MMILSDVAPAFAGTFWARTRIVPVVLFAGMVGPTGHKGPYPARTSPYPSRTPLYPDRTPSYPSRTPLYPHPQKSAEMATWQIASMYFSRNANTCAFASTIAIASPAPSGIHFGPSLGPPLAGLPILSTRALFVSVMISIPTRY
jgi:hypothetical protein